jgi:putative transposase
VATDITYIPMARVYVFKFIIDLHTRFVLNWSVSNTMSAIGADILQETIQSSGVPEIFNTDQGSQYTSENTNVRQWNKKILCKRTSY